MFVFFGTIRKTRWSPGPFIGWDIFNFSFETPKQDSTKLDGKQDLNVLYEVCFPNGKKAGRPSLWLAKTFSTSPLKPLIGIQQKLTERKILTSSTKFKFFGVFKPDWKNKMSCLASDWLRHFWLLLWNRWTEFKVDRKQDLNIPYHVCVFGLISKQKWPPWPFHQKGGTLYSGASYVALWASCFLADWKNKIFVLICCPGLWLAETFLTSSQIPLNRIQWNLTGCKISMSSTKFVFSGRSVKQKKDCRPGLWLVRHV